MNGIEQQIDQAAQLISLGKAKAALAVINTTFESYLRHLAIAHGAVERLANGDSDRLASISAVEFMDFLIEEGILRHRQKADIRDISRLLTSAEREELGPSLEQANRALRLLREFVDRQETTAADVMSGPVMGIDRDDLVEDALTVMRVRGVRRLPVLENGRPARTIIPRTILKLIDEGTPDLARLTVWDVADRGLPQVPPDAKLPDLLRLLRTNPGILVVDDDKVVGMVTASDLLQVVRKYR